MHIIININTLTFKSVGLVRFVNIDMLTKTAFIR